VKKDINPAKLVSLFSALCCGNKVKDFLINYADEGLNRKNIKRFIEFALLNNMIYRVHKYIKLSTASTSESVLGIPNNLKPKFKDDG
jgi:hypothetical protein